LAISKEAITTFKKSKKKAGSEDNELVLRRLGFGNHGGRYLLQTKHLEDQQ
jgi:hypothetical protein